MTKAIGQWFFPELPCSNVRYDPKEAELFKTEQTGEGEYSGTDALVREILQNAVDARCGDAPVRVRLAIHEAKEAPDKARLEHYFARLRAPLALRGIEYDGNRPRLPCRFLVVEDFGTSGLEGDVELFRDPPPGTSGRHAFYWFWRNIGRSGKTGDDLGRWGLGKTVFRAASRAGCMFGLTVRASDRRRLLMGQAVLQIHELFGKEYKPEGYWCGGQNDKGLPMPMETQAELDRFLEEWRLSRDDEPGTSVVVPYVPEELKADRLLQAVAAHFFVRILRGELIVEIAGTGSGTVKLDRTGIAAACRNTKWDAPVRTKRHIPPPIEFAAKCLAAPPPIVTDVLGSAGMPTLDEGTFAEATLHDLRKRFAGGERIGVRVRLHLPQRNGDAAEGRLDVYVQRTDDGQRCDSYFVREGMTITKINSQAAKRGVQAVVLVDPGPLAKLLGDTEGAAHEDWDTSNDERPNKTWQRGWKGRVKFVRRAVDALFEVLTPPATEPDFDLLSDFFSIERVGGPQAQRTDGKEKKERPQIDIGPIEPKWFYIHSRAGGFTVGRQNSVPLPPNPVLKVSIAYDLPQGNPLKKWNPLDFKITADDTGLRPKGKGLRPQLLQGNSVLLREIQEDFQFVVEGFDLHRDLFIRVDDVSNSDEANHD